MKALLPFLSLSLLPFPSIDFPSDPTDPLFFAVSPLLEGYDATIAMRIDESLFPEDYYLFAFKIHYGSTSPLELIDFVHVEERGQPMKRLSLDERFFQGEKRISLYLGANEIDPRDFVDPGLAGPRGVYYPEVFVDVQRLKESFSVKTIESQETVSLGYEYTVGSIAAERYWKEPLQAEFSGIEARLDSHRRIDLSSLRLKVDNPGHMLDFLLGDISCQLRILTYKDEFVGLGRTAGYAYLNLTPETKEENDLGKTYRFVCKREFLYSRKDASMQLSQGSDTFYSSYVYLPLRQGHDDAEYTYQLFFYGVGLGEGKNFVYKGSLRTDHRKFGSKGGADYYVGLGQP